MLTTWLTSFIDIASLSPMTGDASFRQYHRVTTHNNQTFIAVYSPPDKENNPAFIEIAGRLRAQSLHVPVIHQYNLEQGFLLLEDLGDQLFFTDINADNMHAAYSSALKQLVVLQQTPTTNLLSFNDQMLLQELYLFIEWFCEIHLQLTLSTQQKTLLDNIFNLLLDNANAQPQTFIHRDYHSRNLMLLENDIGILDFQDATIGPITYDAASLLRDCYKVLPHQLVQDLLKTFYNDLHLNVSYQTFQQWFDRMGVQRHLKAIFIFARKFHRDHNAAYLPDITRGLHYIEQVSQHDPALTTLHHFLLHELYPRLEEHSA